MKKEGNQNRANQMKPNNRVCYQSRRMMSGKPRQKVNQLLNIFNQINPNNSAYHQPRGMATGAPCQNKNPSQNRSYQMNPNNLAFHKSRGYSTRPKDWGRISQKRKDIGFLEHRANIAGAMSREKRRAIGNDIKKFEKIVKELFDGNVEVYKGGGQKKE